MRHLKTFESYSVAASSPSIQEATEALKLAVESSSELFYDLDEAVEETKSQLSASDIRAIENLLQHTPEELSQKVAMEAPSMTGESRRYAKSRRYNSYQPINESFFKKLKQGIGAVLQWGGIGQLVYGFVNFAMTSIELKAASYFTLATVHAPIAIGCVLLGMLIAKMPWFESIGIDSDKLPRGFGK